MFGDHSAAKALDSLIERIIHSYLDLHDAWTLEAAKCGYSCCGDEPHPEPRWEEAWINCAQADDPIQPDFAERPLSPSQVGQVQELLADSDFLALGNTRVGRHMWLQLKDDYLRRRLSQTMVLVEDCLPQDNSYRLDFSPSRHMARPPLLYLHDPIKPGGWIRLQYLQGSELTVSAEIIFEPQVEPVPVDLKTTLLALCHRLNPRYIFLRQK